MGLSLFRAPRWVRSLALVLVLASTGVLACDLVSLVGGITGSKPTITLQSPTTGSQFREGDEVTVQSTSKDQSGVVRVELAVDGAAVRTDTPPVPQGQTSFALVQKWQATPGTHTVSVRAFNASGSASDPVMVTISVAASGSATSTEQTIVSGPEAAITPLVILVPTMTSTVIPSPRPPTRPPATPTLAAPPGVYATSVRVDPAGPKRGVPPTFRVTFLNTTGKPQSYQWFVKIYEPDKPNSKGETSKIVEDIPPGMTERASAVDWKITGPGPCEAFIARVFWFDRSNNQTTEFVKPDKSGGPATAFQVCP